ncbi:Pyridoxal phosphate-dependent transferase, major region, subdomain 1 [Penicillium occitanis (nom. inval.)]|nr:Pyridoxal phosphate-dependent transferase, major region, subdomain 1 [Penicillium occitanis (nom. inval.)]PCG89030.1 hypothetical protein PENOC_108350 [Penicillium occitanis (nom. inval.)]
MATPTETLATAGLSIRMETTVKAFLPVAYALAARGKIGPEDIDLANGENSLMKLEMVDICKKAMSDSITANIFATPVGFVGDTPVKEALAQYFTNYFHPANSVTADYIVPTAGSGSALDALLYTLCDAGDAVLCPAPAWWGYHPYARFHAEANIIPAFVKPSSSSSWVTDCLSSAIIPAMEAAYNAAPDPRRIKAVLTSNPNNPMMNCWAKDVVRQMMDFCHERNLHYISDEVFANTVFDTEADQFVSALSLLKSPDSEGDGAAMKSLIDPSLVHVLWSTSKDFGACGVRAGCVVSYHSLVRAGVSFATGWQVSSLAAHFTRKLLISDSLPNLISSVWAQLAQGFQTCREILSTPELFGRIEVLHISAGLWANALNGVIVGGATEFAPFLQKEQGLLKITFAMPPDALLQGPERLKASLL